jgi:hypothetical protein
VPPVSPVAEHECDLDRLHGATVDVDPAARTVGVLGIPPLRPRQRRSAAARTSVALAVEFLSIEGQAVQWPGRRHEGDPLGEVGIPCVAGKGDL